MSSSPMPIRRAGPDDVLSRSAKDSLLVTPSGQLYGSTPGGTRIVYSREQLLSLASSPLSKTPPRIPAEISRSPEKTGGSHISHAVAHKSNGIGAGIGSMGKAGNVFSAGHANQNGVNGIHPSASSSSPPAPSSRSPGNAFNFAKGPISPTSTTHSANFKERLAASAQQQQSSPPNKRTNQTHSLQVVNSDALVNDNQVTPNEEQFKMDM